MRWSHPSSECARSAAAPERDGRGSSIALTNTASNNAPKPLPGSTMDNRNYNASAILNQWTLPCSRFKRQNRVDLSGLAHSGLGSGSFRQLKVCSITVLPSPAELACWTLSP